jgi:hypothetical protein
MPRIEKPMQRYSCVEEFLANDPEFIKAGFHIGRFTTATVDTEVGCMNIGTLYTNLKSALTWFNVSIFHLTFCNHSCLVPTPLFI